MFTTIGFFTVILAILFFVLVVTHIWGDNADSVDRTLFVVVVSLMSILDVITGFQVMAGVLSTPQDFWFFEAGFNIAIKIVQLIVTLWALARLYVGRLRRDNRVVK